MVSDFVLSLSDNFLEEVLIKCYIVVLICVRSGLISLYIIKEKKLLAMTINPVQRKTTSFGSIMLFMPDFLDFSYSVNFGGTSLSRKS